MRKFLTPVLAITLALCLGATALAATTYNTAIRLHASDTSISRGDRVVFKGDLNSGFAKCTRDSKVTLYKRGVPVESTRTNFLGNFKFVKHPRKTRTWQVRFAGKTGGTHPNNWVCNASVSKKIRVEVS